MAAALVMNCIALYWFLLQGGGAAGGLGSSMKREREEEYRRDVKATAAARLAVIDKNRLLLSDDSCRKTTATSVRNDDDAESGPCPRSPDMIEGETSATCHKEADVIWTPAQVRVALAVQIDGALLVGDTSDKAEVTADACNIVVLDNFFGEAERKAMMDALTEPGWEADTPPTSKWEKRTADSADAAATWGAKDFVYRDLESGNLAKDAMGEIHSHLKALYPEFEIIHQPAASGADRFVANAAIHGDSFQWHIDADPSALPNSPEWREFISAFGENEVTCPNRNALRPYFVSMIMYLDSEWPLHFDSETLFLDQSTGTGVFVRPQPYRVVLMDQDVFHRLSAPSLAAKRPRYSFVWKLIFLPKAYDFKAGREYINDRRCSICRAEWGPPTLFGSASRLSEAKALLESHNEKSSKP